jgi:trimethylamine--corrinoid protein Co-methyltransferase
LHSGGAILSLFAEADLDDLHNATLEVLERGGVLVEDDEAIDLYADAGCWVDRETHMVRIPPDPVARALLSARRSFVLAGRDPAHDVMVEVGRVTVCPFAEGFMVNDLETGKYRSSVLQDVIDIARISDALEDIDINVCGVTARDVPEAVAELRQLEMMLHHTAKPWMMPMTSKVMAEFGIAMGAAVAGGHDKLRERPLFTYSACPVGLMHLTASATEVNIACARSGVPYACVSMGMAGASSPVTLAGTLVVQNAELLSSLVLHQKVEPGAPFYFGSSTCGFETRRAAAAVGTTECGLIQAGTALMGNYYNIPSWTGGYQTDSKACDCQTGHEKTLTGLLAMLAGASTICGPGMLETGVTFDVAQLVADAEIVAMTKHVRRGIPVNDRTTFVDEIISVGAGNEFLSSKSTLKGARSLSQTKLIDRQVREAWEAAGSPDYYEQAKKEARRILAEHEIEPLPADVAQEVRAIVEGAEVH